MRKVCYKHVTQERRLCRPHQQIVTTHPGASFPLMPFNSLPADCPVKEAKREIMLEYQWMESGTLTLFFKGTSRYPWYLEYQICSYISIFLSTQGTFQTVSVTLRYLLKFIKKYTIHICIKVIHIHSICL